MTTFLQPPLPTPQRSRPKNNPPRCTTSPLPLDPLPAFEAFCQRTKTTLSLQTAEADGIGTFHNPFQYPCTSPPSDNLHGRRFFSTITVFRSPPYKRESVGLALKLVPHDPTLPSLRADVHYFQTHASWWFSGSADLSAGPAGGLSGYGGVFLETWEGLQTRYRVVGGSYTKSFLDVCYSAVDRDTAFGFVGEVVEMFLPAYLPLLLGRPGGGNAREGESLDQFCIVGGAVCESSTLRKRGLVSWSFALAPSAMTAAGRVYDTLREGSVL